MLERLPADLARQAVTHASWTERRSDSYERLAFLGDSVLGPGGHDAPVPAPAAGRLRRRAADEGAGAGGVRPLVPGRWPSGSGIPERLQAAAPPEFAGAGDGAARRAPSGCSRR